MFLNSDSGLRFEVAFRGKDEFGVKYGEIDGKAWILGDSDKDIMLDFNCFQTEEAAHQPELLLELYVDGVLRNVVKPRTGRGLAENQIAEAMIDRGVVLNKDGMPILKRFRFVDLDLDDAILDSRLVSEAGTIEVRIVQAGLWFNEEDDISFELPSAQSDCGAVSLFCGELNNTIGVRFDCGDETLRDTKDIRLERSVELMIVRQNQMLGETLAIFSFQYASAAILLHLGVVPLEHKQYNEEMASERLEVRNRYDASLPKVLIDRAISDSDYTLTANIGNPSLLNDVEPTENSLVNTQCVILPVRRQSTATPDRAAKKKGKFVCATPPRKTTSLQLPLTPPITPVVERTVVYDMTQEEDEIVEIICTD